MTEITIELRRYRSSPKRRGMHDTADYYEVGKPNAQRELIEWLCLRKAYWPGKRYTLPNRLTMTLKDE